MISELAEVGARLEKAVSKLAHEPDPVQRYLQLESLTIAVLDSESEQFEPGVLENYLRAYLALKRLELNVREHQLT